MKVTLRLILLSDTTFARGEGTAGEVDVEIVHDDNGLPRAPAKTLEGLLRDGWLSMAYVFPEDAIAAQEVFGVEADFVAGGSSKVTIGSAVLPDAVRVPLEEALHRRDSPLFPAEVLRALTAVRHQTARDRSTGGGPADGTLRGSRVLLRSWDATRRMELDAPVMLPDDFSAAHQRVLARSCLAVRHAGSGRNRGRGHIRLQIMVDGEDRTATWAQLEP